MNQDVKNTEQKNNSSPPAYNSGGYEDSSQNLEMSGVSGGGGAFEAAQQEYESKMNAPATKQSTAQNSNASALDSSGVSQYDAKSIYNTEISGVNGTLEARQKAFDMKMEMPLAKQGDSAGTSADSFVCAGGQQNGIPNMMSAGTAVPNYQATGNPNSPIQSKANDAPPPDKFSMASSGGGPKGTLSPISNPSYRLGASPDYTKVNFTHGAQIAITRLGLGVTRQGVSMAARAVMVNSGEAGRGALQTAEMAEIAYQVAGKHAINLARAALNAPLKHELAEMMKKYGVQNTKDLLKVLNGELIANGMKPIPTNIKGTQLQILTNRHLRRLKRNGKIPKSVLDAYKEMRRVGLLTTFAKRKQPLRMRISKSVKGISRKMSRYAQRYGGEAGQGLALTLRIMEQAHNAIGATIRTVQLAGKVGLCIAQQAANLAAKGVLNGLKLAAKTASRVGASGAAKSLNGAVGKLQSMSQKRAEKKLQKEMKKLEKLKKKKPSLRSRIKGKIKGKMKKVTGKLWGRLTKRIPGLGHVSKVFNKLRQTFGAVSKVLGAVSAAIGAVIHTIIFVLVGFIALCIVCTLLNNMFLSVFGNFDFSNSKKDQQDKVIEAVQNAYQEDMEKIIDISKKYESFTISYEYDKDSEKYEKMRKKGDSDQFMQTSNCAEVLSMTLSKYDYNLEEDNIDSGSGSSPDADTDSEETKTELITETAEQYAKRLYHGSHQIEIQESVSYDYDDDGNVVAEHKTANAVYRTYAFDSIFQCSEADKTEVIYGTAGGDGTLSGAMNVDQVYAYLRDQGLSHAGACGIMGNLQQESGFNPTCSTGQYYGIEQLGYDGRRQALQAYCSTNGLDYSSIAGQISYLVHELVAPDNPGSIGKRNTLLNILKTTDDVQKAAEVFCVGVERCVYGSDPYHYKSEYWPYSAGTSYAYQQLTKRVRYAQDFANKYAQYKDDWSAISAPVSSSGGGGAAIVAYAESWVGSSIPYGTSGRGQTLEIVQQRGLATDCSGFVFSVFKHFGIEVPQRSADFPGKGKKHLVSNDSKQPGDIIRWDGHVAIYIGEKTVDGKTYDIVHMSNPTANRIAYSKISWQHGPYTVYRYATVSADWDLQTNYVPEGKYIYDNPGGHRTVYDAACGPTSLANIVRNLCGVNVSTLEMCQYSVSVGARASSGTDMGRLISKASKKYNFTYKQTSSTSTVYNHCKNGGMAIAHTSGNQPFSSGGHFMAVVGVKESRVILVDPYYYSSKRGKYTRAGCEVTAQNGVYYVPLNVLGGCNYFYLISKSSAAPAA